VYSYAVCAAVTAWATPVIACLNLLSTTSPQANRPGMFVSEALFIIISFFWFIFAPAETAKSERGIWPTWTKRASSLSSFEPL